MKLNHRPLSNRLSRPPREERRSRKGTRPTAEGSADQQIRENAAAIAQIRLMKDALGQFWAARVANG